jgi:hypothetical protein
MKSVTVNGQDHSAFDAARELITLPVTSGKLEVVAFF